MADDECQKKLEDLQRYVPFLENTIKQLNAETGKLREAQIAKLHYLLVILTDTKRKLKYDSLMKCEEVILKLYEKMDQKSPAEAMHKYMCHNPPEFIPKTHSPIFDSKVALSVARQKLIKQTELTLARQSSSIENATTSNPLVPVVTSTEKLLPNQFYPVQNTFNSQLHHYGNNFGNPWPENYPQTYFPPNQNTLNRPSNVFMNYSRMGNQRPPYFQSSNVKKDLSEKPLFTRRNDLNISQRTNRSGHKYDVWNTKILRSNKKKVQAREIIDYSDNIEADTSLSLEDISSKSVPPPRETLGKQKQTKDLPITFAPKTSQKLTPSPSATNLKKLPSFELGEQSLPIDNNIDFDRLKELCKVLDEYKPKDELPKSSPKPITVQVSQPPKLKSLQIIERMSKEQDNIPENLLCSIDGQKKIVEDGENMNKTIDSKLVSKEDKDKPLESNESYDNKTKHDEKKVTSKNEILKLNQKVESKSKECEKEDKKESEHDSKSKEIKYDKQSAEKTDCNDKIKAKKTETQTSSTKESHEIFESEKLVNEEIDMNIDSSRLFEKDLLKQKPSIDTKSEITKPALSTILKALCSSKKVINEVHPIISQDPRLRIGSESQPNQSQFEKRKLPVKKPLLNATQSIEPFLGNTMSNRIPIVNSIRNIPSLLSLNLQQNRANMDNMIPCDPFSNNICNKIPGDLFSNNMGDRMPDDPFLNNMDNKTSSNSFAGSMMYGNSFLNTWNNAPQNIGNRTSGDPFLNMTSNVDMQQFNKNLHHRGLDQQDQFLNQSTLDQFGLVNYPNQPQNMNPRFPNSNTQDQQNFNAYDLSQINPINSYGSEEKNQRQSSFDYSKSFKGRGRGNSTRGRRQFRSIQYGNSIVRKEISHESYSHKRQRKKNTKKSRKGRYEQSRNKSRFRSEDSRSEFRSRYSIIRSFNNTEDRRNNYEFSQNEETSKFNEDYRKQSLDSQSIYNSKSEDILKQPLKQKEGFLSSLEKKQIGEEYNIRKSKITGIQKSVEGTKDKAENIKNKAETELHDKIEKSKDDYVEKVEEPEKNEKTKKATVKETKTEPAVSTSKETRETEEECCNQSKSGSDEKLDMLSKFMEQYACDSTVLLQYLEKCSFPLHHPITKKIYRSVASDSGSGDDKLTKEDEIEKPKESYEGKTVESENIDVEKEELIPETKEPDLEEEENVVVDSVGQRIKNRRKQLIHSSDSSDKHLSTIKELPNKTKNLVTKTVEKTKQTRKHRGKHSFELLRKDLRNIIDNERVLTPTRKRMCRIMKEHQEKLKASRTKEIRKSQIQAAITTRKHTKRRPIENVEEMPKKVKNIHRTRVSPRFLSSKKKSDTEANEKSVESKIVPARHITRSVSSDQKVAPEQITDVESKIISVRRTRRSFSTDQRENIAPKKLISQNKVDLKSILSHSTDKESLIDSKEDTEMLDTGTSDCELDKKKCRKRKRNNKWAHGVIRKKKRIKSVNLSENAAPPSANTEISNQFSATTEYVTEIRTNEPLTTEYVPEIKTNEPATTKYVPEIGTNGSVTTEYVPKIKATETAITKYIPEIRTHEPTATKCVPEIKTNKPTATEYVPEIKTNEPTTTECVPEIKRNEPATTEYVPKIRTNEPATTEYVPEIRNEPTNQNSSENEFSSLKIDYKPDINYFLYKADRFECKLCDYSGKFIVPHYRSQHPESENMISRISPEQAEQAKVESKLNKFKSIEPHDELIRGEKSRSTFVCRFCGLSFPNEFAELFFDHLASHTGEYRYYCTVCPFHASNKKILSHHCHTMHLKLSKPLHLAPSWPGPPNFRIVFGYLCDVCNFTQLLKENVQKHIKLSHQDEDIEIIKINMSNKHISLDDLNLLDKPEEVIEIKKTPELVKEPNTTSFLKSDDITSREQLIEADRRKKIEIISNEVIPRDNILSFIEKLQKQIQVKGNEGIVEKIDSRIEIENHPVDTSIEKINLQILHSDTSENETNSKKPTEKKGSKIISKSEADSKELIEQKGSNKDNTYSLVDADNDEHEKICTNSNDSLDSSDLHLHFSDEEIEEDKKIGIPAVELGLPTSLEQNVHETAEVKSKIISVIDESSKSDIPDMIEKTEDGNEELVIDVGAIELHLKNKGTEPYYCCKVPNCCFSSLCKISFTEHCSKSHVKLAVYCKICESETLQIRSTPFTMTSLLAHLFDKHKESAKPKKDDIQLRSIPGDDLLSKQTRQNYLESLLEALNQPIIFESSTEPTTERQSVLKSQEKIDMLQIENVRTLTPEEENNLRCEKQSAIKKLTEPQLNVMPIPQLSVKNPQSFVKSVADSQLATHSTSSANNQIIVQSPPTNSFHQYLGIGKNPTDKKLSLGDIIHKIKTKSVFVEMIQLPNILNLYKCPFELCAYSTNMIALFEAHSKSHRWCQITSCVYCGEGVSFENMINHIDKNHAHCRFQCALCFYRAISKKYLFLHQKNTHQVVPQADISYYEVKSIEPVFPFEDIDVEQVDRGTLLLPYICRQDNCNLNFLMVDDFMVHLHIYHKTLFECCVCSENNVKNVSFTTAQALVNHYGLHGVDKYQCSFCLHGTRVMKCMLTHYSKKHPNMKPICFIRLFKSKNNPKYTIDDILAIDISSTTVTKKVSNKNITEIQPKCSSLIITTQTKNNDSLIRQELPIAEKVNDKQNSQEKTESNVFVEIIDLTNDNQCGDKLNKSPDTLKDGSMESKDTIENTVNQTVTKKISGENITEMQPKCSSLIITTQTKNNESLIRQELPIAEKVNDKPNSQEKTESIADLGIIDLTYDNQCGDNLKKPLDTLKNRSVGSGDTVENVVNPLLVDNFESVENTDFSEIIMNKQEELPNIIPAVEAERPLITGLSEIKRLLCEKPEVPKIDGEKSVTRLRIIEKLLDLQIKNTYGLNDIKLLPRTPIFPTEIKCKLCCFSTKWRYDMQRHLQQHDEKVMPKMAAVNSLPCLKKNVRVDKTIISPARLHSRRISRPTEEKVDKNNKKDLRNFPGFIPASKRFVCGAENCTYSTHGDTMLRLHLTALHADETIYKCPHCKIDIPSKNKDMDIDQILFHLKMHDRHLYKCQNCQFLHYQKHKIERHISINHQEENIEIDVIRELDSSANITNFPEQIDSHDEIRNRALNVHGIESQYKCELCQFKCSAKNDFSAHYRKNHLKEEIRIAPVYHKTTETEDLATCSQNDSQKNSILKILLKKNISPSKRTPEIINKFTDIKSNLEEETSKNTVDSARNFFLSTLARESKKLSKKDKSYICTHCNLIFSHPSQVKSHNAKEHNNLIIENKDDEKTKTKIMNHRKTMLYLNADGSYSVEAKQLKRSNNCTSGKPPKKVITIDETNKKNLAKKSTSLPAISKYVTKKKTSNGEQEGYSFYGRKPIDISEDKHIMSGLNVMGKFVPVTVQVMSHILNLNPTLCVEDCKTQIL